MTQAKHTPGLWFHDVDGFGSNRVGAFGFDTHDGTIILAQVRAPREISFETAKANARLIAAAPDLLEALEEVLPQNLGPLPDGQPDNMTIPVDMTFGEIRRARAAIAKAKGETP